LKTASKVTKYRIQDDSHNIKTVKNKMNNVTNISNNDRAVTKRIENLIKKCKTCKKNHTNCYNLATHSSCQ